MMLFSLDFDILACLGTMFMLFWGHFGPLWDHFLRHFATWTVHVATDAQKGGPREHFRAKRESNLASFGMLFAYKCPQR